MHKSESIIQKKWKELEQPSDEEKVIRRSLVKLRDWLRSQSRSPTGVLSKTTTVDGNRLLVRITKLGWMAVEYHTKKTEYSVKLVDGQVTQMTFKFLKGNRAREDLMQMEIVTALKEAFKLHHPLYNVKVKTTSASTIAKRLLPSGYSAMINTTGPKINGTPANLY